jgi:hypothetical protein
MAATAGASVRPSAAPVAAVGTGDRIDEALDRALALAELAPAPPGAVILADPAVDAGLLERLVATLPPGATVIDPPTGPPVPLDYGGAVGRHLADPAWAQAGFRILVAKNRTHRRLLYAGAMTTVLRAVPELPRVPAELPDICRAALEALPVGFALVDAFESRDRRGRRPTGAVLAATDVLALDWLMGEKMELDPELNPVVREGVLRWGRARLDRRGNLTPWADWRNVTLAGAALADVWARVAGPARL